MFVVFRIPCQDHFSHSNLHDLTNSVIEISEVGVQLPQWQTTLHLYVLQYVQVWRNSCACYLFTHFTHPAQMKLQSFSWGTLTNRQKNMFRTWTGCGGLPAINGLSIIRAPNCPQNRRFQRRMKLGFRGETKSVREERERKKRKWGLGMHFPQKGHNSL